MNVTAPFRRAEKTRAPMQAPFPFVRLTQKSTVAETFSVRGAPWVR